MTKQTIEVEGLPEGWRVKTMTIRPRHTKEDKFRAEAILELEKIKPRRIVLQETSEEIDATGCQLLVIDDVTLDIYTDKLWKEVKETDIALNSDETKLELNADDLRRLIEDNDDPLWIKINEFIKENS